MQRLLAAKKVKRPSPEESSGSGAECGAALMDVLPRVMLHVRKYMRMHREGLSVPQFRALLHVSHAPDATVSSMAEHLGVSVPTASRVLSGLVRRGLLTRVEAVSDRRRMSIGLTDPGRHLLAGARRASVRGLETHFVALSDQERAGVLASMRTLSRAFAHEEGSSNGHPNGRSIAGARNL